MSDRLIVLVALALALAVVPAAGAAASTADATATDASPALQESTTETNVTLEVSSGTVEPGENVTVLVRAFNEGPDNATNLTVDLRELPDGWEVVSQEPTRDGSYAADAVTWSWDRTPPREYATVSVTLQAPEEVAADASATVAVEVEGETVTTTSLALAPPSTSTTTITDGTTTTGDVTTTVVDDPSPTPGFGVALALVAVVAGALLATRRR